jgi:hypothetical protein
MDEVRSQTPVRDQDSVPPTYVGSNNGITGQVRSPNSLLLDAARYVGITLKLPFEKPEALHKGKH